MKRGRPTTGSVSQVRPGVWRVRVSVDSGDGGRRVLSKTIEGDRGDAERQRAELILEADRLRDRPGRSSADNLAGWLETWLHARRGRISKHTVATYARVIKNHIAPALGTRRLRQLTATTLTSFYSDLAERGLAPSTIDQCHFVLSGALKLAARDGLIAENPAQFAERPGGVEKPVPVPAHEDLAAVLAANAGRWEATAILVLLGTAIRRGEAIGLRWSDIDLEAGSLRVERTVEHFDGAFHVGPPKSRASRRSVGLPAALAAHLREYRQRQRKDFMARGVRCTDDLVFPTARGGLQHPSSFGAKIRAAGARAGVYLTPHLLRHRAATDLLEAHLHPKIAQARLGHANASVTVRTYQHVLAKAAEQGTDAANRVLEFVTGAQNRDTN